MFKRNWYVQSEAGDDAVGDLSGGDGAAPDAGVGGAGGEGAGADTQGAEGSPAKPLTEAQVVTGMDEAIKAALSGDATKAPAAKEEPKPGDAKTAEPRAADPKAADKPAKEKTLEELALTELEKKHWKAETQERYNGLLGQLKATSAERDALRAEGQSLAKARDAILGVMRETHTSDEDLTQLLEFNRLVKTGSLEQALQLVEGQRTAILKAMGREAPGVDLLKDHPDLQQDVDELKITRERALELVKARQDRARVEASSKAAGSEQAARVAHQQAADAALDSIEKWTGQLAKSDIDYSAKEAKLLAKVAGVVKEYPPAQWLSTLKLLYEGIEIAKAAPGPRGEQPLRGSGARPGNVAPTSMLEAINQGLGYEGKK